MRASRPVVLLLVASGVALGGCGGDDGATGASTGTTSSAPATAPRPTTVVGTDRATTEADPASGVTAVTPAPPLGGTDARRGISIALVPAPDDGFPAEQAGPDLRAVVRVASSAPRSVRRRLARTAGWNVECVGDGVPGTAIEVRPRGPRDQVDTGVLFRTDGFVGPDEQARLRVCGLRLASESRGSSARTYASGPPWFAEVRLR